MKIKNQTKADWRELQATEAVDIALDATLDEDNCEAWYEAMEAVSSRQYPDGKKEVQEALNFIRSGIDERY